MIRGQHLIGKVLGSCVLEKVVGHGGSSVVFLALQSNPERKVAVKVFLPRSSLNKKTRQDFYDRFLREAEAASQLDHANILPIYSYGEQDGLPYIIMPYMSGGTLSEYVTKHGPVSLEEARYYLEQLASALDYAHEHGCVHCDIKPANILLDGEGRVVLSDFGIARHMQADAPAESSEIQTPELLMGTPDYISPEQALGHTLDGRSDVYSLGVTLFYLLTKRLPFKADTKIAVALLHVHETPPSLALIRADATVSLDHVLHKALAKGPEQRFQTARAFSDAFAQAIIITEQTGVVTSGRKYARLLVRRFTCWMNELRSRLIAEKPALRVKSLVQYCIATPHFVSISTFLLVSILVASSVTYFLSVDLVSGTPHASLLTTEVDGAHIDRLTMHDKWPIGSTFFYGQHDQYYYILNNSIHSAVLASYADSQFSNFRFSVTTLEIRHPQGEDYYGVVFRSSTDQSHYYLLEVTSDNGGQYIFSRYDGGGGSSWQSLAHGDAPSLLSGKTNTITVEANGNNFTFFINDKVVGKMSDTSKLSLTTGQIGLYVEDQNAEVAFSHLYIQPNK